MPEENVNTDWHMVAAWETPPAVPLGYDLEVETDCMFGLPLSYRFTPTLDTLARLKVEGHA